MRWFLRRRKKQDYTAPKAREIPTEMYFDIVRQCLANTGRTFVRVTGVSMKPFLYPVRDTVEIVPPRPLRRGDIALFDTRYGRYILHRVTCVQGHTFSMRGDNTVRGEKALPQALLVGVVDAAVRNGKRIPNGSLLWKLFAAFGPLHASWVRPKNKIRSILTRIYHCMIPRKLKEEQNAEN